MDLTDFGGMSTLTLHLPQQAIPANVGREIPIVRLSRCWTSGRELTILGSPHAWSLDMHNPQVDSGNQILSIIHDDTGSTIRLRSTDSSSTDTLGSMTRVSFASLNLQFPLPERAPVNRSVIGLRIEWLISAPAVRLEIRRKSGSVTCFTKGNYALAFPARSSAGLTSTTIMYPPAARHDLLYGFIEDPSRPLLRSASSVVLGGLTFLAAWLMLTLLQAKSHSSGDLANYWSILFALIVPFFSAGAELTVFDRHTLYARRRDIGFTLLASVMGTSTIGVLYFLLCILLDPHRISIPWENAGYYFLIMGLTFLLLGLFVVSSYRSGLVVPYVCDNHFCARRLYFRYRLRDCYPTGRVVCRRCYKSTCVNCSTNYWLRGESAYESPGMRTEDPPTNICQPIRRER
ncbi:hypothetical protein [Streptantibioticus silvisoli]|uniref:Uncharacterized protein n=1 Tax=Streptantibioticus silvisoli TaxID=2705255 RepID=A0ABT6W7W2_9ACTN|nr:hypothetical protein [Streptantibioticus silvisoli]MDI5966839.1 hypothetical protein [Streptantibioticus silvisoli]